MRGVDVCRTRVAADEVFTRGYDDEIRICRESCASSTALPSTTHQNRAETHDRERGEDSRQSRADARRSSTRNAARHEYLRATVGACVERRHNVCRALKTIGGAKFEALRDNAIE